MDLRRSPWSAVIWLAVVVSAIAVAVTLALSAFGDVSQTAMVIAVIVVAFIVSWIQSGRAHDHDGGSANGSSSLTGDGGRDARAGGDGGHASHRVVVVPLHRGVTRRAV
ncbi:MAG: hypothetical protein WD225_06950 [Ilumatobacteraceae bacterium]